MATPVIIEAGSVTIAGTLAVTQSGTWNINDIAGSISLPTGASTAAKQDTGNASLASIDGKITAVNTGAVVISSGTITGITNPVAVTGTFWQATQPISAATLPLPSGAATSALQTQPGVDIGDVTVNNAAGAAAVNIQDGGNTITVDGTVSAAVTGSVTANAGTNLNTSLLALESGGNLSSLAAKDFATETTLALIKAKTDNLDVTLSGGGTHVIVDSMPPVTASTSAVATVAAPEYTEGVAEDLSQDLLGNLRTRVSAQVNESPQSYIDGVTAPLSLTAEGRLRVSAVSAATYLEYFVPFDYSPQDNNTYLLSTSPWSAL